MILIWYAQNTKCNRKDYGQGLSGRASGRRCGLVCEGERNRSLSDGEGTIDSSEALRWVGKDTGQCWQKVEFMAGLDR